MIFMGLEFMNEVPFKEVFIHGLVLDAEGRKMSKSLGNGIDPLEIVEKYGADTMRMMLITGNTPGNDLRFRIERLEGARNFCNKIWNASRFVMMNLDGFEPNNVEPIHTLADKWILSRYNQTVAEVTRLMERYDFGEASRVLYEFIWNEYCDWYIEIVKPRLYGKEDEASRKTAQYVLWYVLENALKLLHPFMPFITEEIWQHLPHEGETIMLQKCPQFMEILQDSDAEEQMEIIMDVIKSIRNIRSLENIPPSKKAQVIIGANSPENEGHLKGGVKYIENLASADEVEIYQTLEQKPEQAMTAVVRGIEIFLPLKGLIDFEKESERLKKEIANMDKELTRVNGKLTNQGFLAKAPEEVIEKEKAKQVEYQSKKDALLERLESLKA